MKQTIIAIFTIIAFGACAEPTVQKKQSTIVTEYGGAALDIVIIEGCEYFHFRHGHAYMMCHKGNCKNKIHIYNK